eukprot:scaffold2926_cov399-Prasinococcus_capsulatus_cf.AAC.4
MQGKKVEHQGIKIELLGQIENLHERGSVYEFIQLKRELEPPGELLQVGCLLLMAMACSSADCGLVYLTPSVPMFTPLCRKRHSHSSSHP